MNYNKEDINATLTNQNLCYDLHTWALKDLILKHSYFKVLESKRDPPVIWEIRKTKLILSAILLPRYSGDFFGLKRNSDYIYVNTSMCNAKALSHMSGIADKFNKHPFNVLTVKSILSDYGLSSNESLIGVMDKARQDKENELIVAAKEVDFMLKIKEMF